ncbi:Enoyl-CoA delta isomerase 3 [Geodia barretti]|uniref:Enoyl-CoA delta isomerase 3 n=1 Tax=Geodia barretti TaxID=519541 RepID=A0AA35TTR8_GEOBA|nr:Enoyl-CoA delta isomerase 3 [Geodia barretti]
MDLDYLLSVSGNEMTQIMADLQRLYCRLLTFPMVTVAAANGHIYAAGALLYYIIMNNSKGFFCFPEIKLKFSFPAALLELAKARMAKRGQRAVLVLGRRYGGQEAHAAGLVDECVHRPS